MSKLNELYALVHSLGKGEKRSLRLFVQQKGSTQPVQLLNKLLDHSPWDEELLLQELATSGLATQLPTHIPRLRKIVLQSLELLESEGPVEYRLRSAIFEIDILYRKRLTDQVPKRISKARRLARQYSCFSEELKLIDWERRILLIQQPKNIIETQERINQEEEEVFNLLRLLRKITDLQHRMRSLVRLALRSGSPGDLKQLEPIYKDPNLPLGLASPNFLIRNSARHCIGLYHMTLSQGQEAVDVFTTMMEDWKSNREWINAHPELFLASYNNFLGCFQDHEHLDIQEGYSDYFSTYSFKAPHVRLRFQQINFMSSLIMHLNLGAIRKRKTILCRS